MALDLQLPADEVIGFVDLNMMEQQILPEAERRYLYVEVPSAEGAACLSAQEFRIGTGCIQM